MWVPARALRRGAIYFLAVIAATAFGFYLAGAGPSRPTIASYLPHGFCYTWQPGLMALHVVSDVLIGLAYISIPLTLLYFIRRRTDLPFNWMFVLFGIFIVACGATHWMEVWTLWHPDYWLSGTVKAVTAAASVPTAIMLVALVPRALAIPSAAQLREAKDALEAEVVQRKRAEDELRGAHAVLEQRVAERTAELARANDELMRRGERLHEADRRKDRFIAMLSHELRNPLHAISAAAAFLQRAGEQHGRLRDAQSVIVRQLRTLSRMLDELLDVSRFAQGKMELEIRSVDLRDIVRAALEANAPNIAASGVQLRYESPATPVVVSGDALRLEQIVSNLVHNATKYTDRGGEVHIELCAADGKASVAVRDTGAGIVPEDIPRIFELFEQGASTATRAAGGLGIGLHLARILARLHGGDVEARSAGAGRGSEFTLALPLAGESPAALAAGESSAADTPLSILLVDDNIDAARSLQMLLDAQGHAVDTAFDGRQALSRLEAQAYDVAFIDIGLPDMDGYEVARRVRSLPLSRSTRLVALTGWGQEEDKAKAAAAGFQHHVTKPAAVETLYAILAASARARAGPG